MITDSKIIPGVCLALTFSAAVLTGCDKSSPQGSTASSASIVSSATPENFKIAFIGDQWMGQNAVAVLNLIKSEGAQAVVHLGDFDYEDNPEAWEKQINDTLGADFPYFAVIGNHDVVAWSKGKNGEAGYQQRIMDRFLRLGISWVGDLGVRSSFKYKDIFFILVAPGIVGTVHDAFIRDQLASDNSVWSITAWHKNMSAMQVGGQPDETGWGVYEEARKGGAIIATAHEHSYHRTRTLIDMDDQIVHPEWTDPNILFVDQGSTFVFVSGVGGASIRNQERCFPAAFPYGCKGEWAMIYTTNQSAMYPSITHGALFLTFHVDGNPEKARGYFKTIGGNVLDTFEITSAAGGI